jgi:hypothetical protein
MKIALSLIAVFLFIAASNAQSRTIGQDEYEKVFEFAVAETNADYLLIFRVTTSYLENGKTIRTLTEVNENEAAGRYRIKRTSLAGGRETSKYQLTVGFGNIFCSDDGKTWKTSKYECLSERMLYGNREAESVEYGVTETSVNGKSVTVYRKYSVFAPSKKGMPKTFNEKISTLDSRGYFITVVDTEGTLDPKTITLIRE